MSTLDTEIMVRMRNEINNYLDMHEEADERDTYTLKNINYFFGFFIFELRSVYKNKEYLSYFLCYISKFDYDITLIRTYDSLDEARRAYNALIV